jgi:hypothetical protein
MGSKNRSYIVEYELSLPYSIWGFHSGGYEKYQLVGDNAA